MTDVADVLLAAEELERDHRDEEALTLLARSSGADLAVDRQLVALRHRVALSRLGATGRDSWPPTYPDPFGPLAAPPEVSPDALDAAAIGGGILHHGCLLVRGLIPPEEAASLRADIDDAFVDFAAEHDVAADDRQTWIPYDPGPDYPATEGHRRLAGALGGLFLGDCPRILARLLRSFEDTGVLAAVAEYLGEQPALMFEKALLRRMEPLNERTTWHQDSGAPGLPLGVRTVNLWLSLSHCGGDAKVPALEVLPHRYDEVFPSDDPVSPCIVPYSTVDRLAEVSPPMRPEFAPGDALLFDEVFVHRTALDADMTAPRHAIESWFYAPSSYPGGSVPLGV